MREEGGRKGREKGRKEKRGEGRREGGRKKDCIYIIRHKKPSSTLLNDRTQVVLKIASGTQLA